MKSDFRHGLLGLWLERATAEDLPALAPLEAADLYAAMLGDSLASVAGSRARDIVLFHEGPSPRSYLAPQLMETLLGRQYRLLERP